MLGWFLCILPWTAFIICSLVLPQHFDHLLEILIALFIIVNVYVALNNVNYLRTTAMPIIFISLVTNKVPSMQKTLNEYFKALCNTKYYLTHMDKATNLDLFIKCPQLFVFIQSPFHTFHTSNSYKVSTIGKILLRIYTLLSRPVSLKCI